MSAAQRGDFMHSTPEIPQLSEVAPFYKGGNFNRYCRVNQAAANAAFT